MRAINGGVVIVGASAAARAVTDALRDEGYDGAVTILDPEDHGAAGLDIDRRLVITTSAEAFAWDRLVIADGTEPGTGWLAGSGFVPGAVPGITILEP